MSETYEPSTKFVAHETLHTKYAVRRLNDTTHKHDECRYFVLDPQHDSHARMALAAYAASVRPTNPVLADELRAWLRGVSL